MAWSRGVSTSKRIIRTQIILATSGIVVLEDHLMMDLQLNKMKVFVAVQLQVQQHIPES